ncbi:hypothetical protein BWQ96_02438 [Gracilariopsis chorda]|uniref:WD repeat-containing protein 74 n=1 Tax=Gracilariopsis chorda TaxID=448386 RepID=A0A2V3J013_9FLOR|nr:hypothetical protein BWQ96_02438 [Gracilariopsis chorda]|eukprot:PXF47756.1 hypothetical protein BWQ96_02438 [Gracilariopsis chorda]
MVSSVEQAAVLTNRQLFRGVLCERTVKLPLSAAGVQASRLAAGADGSFIFATGPDVYKLKCSPTRKRARSEEDDGGSAGGKDAPAVSRAIADDYLVPAPFGEISAERFVIHCAHRAQVESVAADEWRVASVDAYGRCIITCTEQIHGGEHARSDACIEKTRSYTLAPVSLSDGDGGWCGVSLRRNDSTTAVVARQMYRDVSIFDIDTAVRRMHTIAAPQAVTVCGEGDVIGIAERKELSLFDGRVGENDGCTGRKNLGHGRLLCLDSSDDGLVVAAGGMDRVLHVFDVRMMKVRERWSGCLKYEMGGCVLSREMEGMAYVCSVDNEVACGAWSSEMAAQVVRHVGTSKSVMISGANTKSARRAFGFRGDVRLTGIARRNVHGEEVGVMSESGAFYLLRTRLE